MTPSEMLNEPVVFAAGNERLRLRRLSTLRRIAIMEAVYTERMIDALVADGKDIPQTVRALPAGKALTEAALKQPVCDELWVRYVTAACVDAVPQADIERALRAASIEQFAAIAAWLDNSDKPTVPHASYFRSAADLGITPDQLAEMSDAQLRLALPGLLDHIGREMQSAENADYYAKQLAAMRERGEDPKMTLGG